MQLVAPDLINTPIQGHVSRFRNSPPVSVQSQDIPDRYLRHGRGCRPSRTSVPSGSRGISWDIQATLHGSPVSLGNQYDLLDRDSARVGLVDADLRQMPVLLVLEIPPCWGGFFQCVA